MSQAKVEIPSPAPERNGAIAEDASSKETVSESGIFPSLLPVLPLSDVVVFPFMVAPLLVSAKSSIRLIDEVVGSNRLLALVLQLKPDIEDPAPKDLYEFGCAARVLKMLKFPDESVRVLVQGLKRIKIARYETDSPFLRAQIVPMNDQIEKSIEAEALARNAAKQFEQIITLSPNLPDELKVALLNMDDPGKLSDLIAANLSIPLQEKQKFLETASVKSRLSRLSSLLQKELDVLQLGSEIQNKVSTALSKSQREYFLREQLRQIQKELGESEGGGETAELRDKVEKAQMPEEVKKIAVKELDRLGAIPSVSAEYTVVRTYLDWLIAMPWSKRTEDQLDIARAHRILDADHYGLKKVKERILEHLAILKLKPDKKGPILCFAGPPGVGKTSLGMSIARALGRKFVRISLGGVRDEAEIRGHRRTYIGALPGRIIQGLRKAEFNNPVFMLDEIDKVGADFRGDPSAALLEVLDPAQNFSFSDHYLELPFDLSRVLFITTANWLEPVPPALRDRMEVLELPGYTEEEKLHIATDYLVPRQREEHGLQPAQIHIPAATLRRLICDYTREAGVRNMDREIASLCRKVGRQIVEGKRQRMTLQPSDLKGLLGSARFFMDVAERVSETGVATGLAWTPVGGEILFIEASRMKGKGNLILTGSLGEVMQESAQAALSYVKAHARGLRIPQADLEKSDIHIHIPSGATPKDGPSAGVTLAVALASLLTKRKVHPCLAMTGEISLRGRILPVGGIKEKMLAAARSGIRTVLLPDKNMRDLEEIPPEIRRKLKFISIKAVGEAFKLALAG
ncbi:MAG: endopeptidase La [Verrucomicrobia bacterium]|nr:endopeptidase La [Verrucomicrobiota bacterium]